MGKNQTPEQIRKEEERQRRQENYQPFNHSSFDGPRKVYTNPVSPRTFSNFKALAKAEGFIRDDGRTDVGAYATALVEAAAKGDIVIVHNKDGHKTIHNMYLEAHAVSEPVTQKGKEEEE